MTVNVLGQLASPAEWRAALDSLPSDPSHIPAFFFAHGHPTLLWPDNLPLTRPDLFGSIAAPNGLLCQFLRDFGSTLIKKYNPKGIVIFSAHWETNDIRLVSDYGDENPLLYDYYGFPQQLYDITWKSKGDRQLSESVVNEFNKHGIHARLSPVTENRGRDGRTQNRPRYHSGLDHGVFIPCKLMFPDTSSSPFPIPIVEVSQCASLSPSSNYSIGGALSALRDQGILILAGGLTIHTFDDMTAFNERKAKPEYHVWNDKIVDAINKKGSEEERKNALMGLTKEKEFRLAHPREEHFVPLYIAAGAGAGGESRLLSGLFGATTVAFGL